MRLVKLLGLSAALIVLMTAVSKTGSVGLAQANCTVTVQPGESIQKAIDAAQEGAIICLTEGIWEEGDIRIIEKGITLRGAGREKTKLALQEETLAIFGASQGLVSLERLSITQGGILANIWIIAGAKVKIFESQISTSGGNGIFIVGSKDVTIISSELSDNEGYGIYMQEPGQITIMNSQISGNGGGIFMQNLWEGLGGHPIKAIIIDSQIAGNGGSGLTLAGGIGAEVQAEIKNSFIYGNGTSENCKKKESVCDGITVYWQSRAKLISSKIISNAHWGVRASLKRCGFPYDLFGGQVIFEGMEISDISGNNTMGNQDGLGNPGNHYWNRSDIPDGQVCLP
jgi:parallel beta-helix repeat protein